MSPAAALLSARKQSAAGLPGSFFNAFFRCDSSRSGVSPAQQGICKVAADRRIARLSRSRSCQQIDGRIDLFRHQRDRAHQVQRVGIGRMPGEDRLRAFCRRSDVPPDEESASLLQQPAYVRSGIPAGGWSAGGGWPHALLRGNQSVKRRPGVREFGHDGLAFGGVRNPYQRRRRSQDFAPLGAPP